MAAKLALTIALLFAVASYLLLTLLDYEGERLLDQRERSERHALHQLAVALAAPLEFDDDIAITSTIAPLLDGAEVVLVEVVDGDRDDAVARIGDEQLAVPRLGAGTSLRDSAHLWLTMPVTAEHGEPLGAITVALSMPELEQVWARQRAVIVLACAGFGAMLLTGLVLATRTMVLLPLGRLARAADAIGRGRIVAIDIRSGDEVGRLAEAFTGMASAIAERERRLARAHAEVGRLLDGMRQAIFTFGPDLRVVGRRSRACAEVFGQEIDGIDAHALLTAGIPESSPEYHAIDAFLGVVYEVDPGNWDQLIELAPRDLQINPGTPLARELAIEFVPLVSDGHLEHVMVLASDETEARRVKREMAALEDRHAAEIAAMRRLLGVGVQVYVEFETSSVDRLERAAALLASDDGPATVVGELVRLIHAVRGGARVLGLLELEAVLSEAENVLAPVGDAVRAGTPIPPGWRSTVLVAVAAARESLTRARQRMIAASPLGEDVLDQVTVSARDLDRLMTLRDHGDAAVKACIDRVCARPFADVVTGMTDAVAFWASSSGKRAQLQIHGAEIRVRRGTSDGLRTAIVQVVRNAIAHGIELPEQRAAAGKPALGSVVIRCIETAGGAVIEIRDDGGGIPLEILRHRAAALGVDVDDAALIFVEGLSSRGRADDLAGRGVGLAAVRFELRDLGYELYVESTGSAGTCFRIRPVLADAAEPLPRAAAG